MRIAAVILALAPAFPAMAEDLPWRTPQLDQRTLQRLHRGEPAGRFVERREAGGQTEFYTRARAGSGWLCEAERLRVVTVQDRSGRPIRSAAVQTVYRAPPSGGCESLSRGVTYFTATDSVTANLAVDVVHEVIRARRARSRPLFNTECDPDCDFLLTVEDLARAVRSVERASVESPEGPATRITVRLEGPGSGYEIGAVIRPGTDSLRQRIVEATARALP